MTDADLLAALPGLAFAFTLVLCRTGAVIMLMPGLGEADPPPILRAGLALALTLLLLPAIAPLVPASAPGWGAAGMVAAELLAGAALGWLARLPALAIAMAGTIVSAMTGLSSVLQQDPALGAQSDVLSRMFGVAVPMLVLSTGLYALPLSALAGSYQLLPPGEVLPAGPTAESVQAALSALFGLAIRLAAPFLLVGTLFQAALGLLGRLVPQLQVFTIAAPGQILGGLLLLALLAAPMLATWSAALAEAWSTLPGL